MQICASDYEEEVACFLLQIKTVPGDGRIGIR